MDVVETYKKNFLAYLNAKIQVTEPVNLYEPIHYILQLGGKRLRPVLTLMTCNLFGGKVEQAYDAALAIEVFHNFTLIHDDIMDSAPLRRGHKTVHAKWNLNTGILSGDAMQIMAYQCFERYEPILFKKLINLFSKTAIEVCEGQQLDIDFETKKSVSIEEYIHMISFKTSVLVAAAMKMGALIANCEDNDAEKMYEFGLNLGIAFQLQDDLLDTFGNAATFGKQIGGDILENKKTFLFIKSLEVCSIKDKEELLRLYENKEFVENKVERVTELFRSNNVEKITKQEISNYTEKAFKVLELLNLEDSKKSILKDFGNNLMQRTV